MKRVHFYKRSRFFWLFFGMIPFDLFVWNFSSHLNIFHSFGDLTIAGEGLQILTFARHLRPLSIEGSLGCHTYCDMGHPFHNGHIHHYFDT